jgi:hypothetical protein
MDSMGALALATELPNIELLDQKPNGRDEPLISRRMWKHILVQGFYQMFWMFLILYGLPVLGNPRYLLSTECEYYSSDVNGRSYCVAEVGGWVGGARPARRPWPVAQRSLRAAANPSGRGCTAASAAAGPGPLAGARGALQLNRSAAARCTTFRLRRTPPPLAPL